MKPRHAAALALVGWYLIGPLPKPDGTLDRGAPMSKWEWIESFDSLRDCKKYKHLVTDLQSARASDPNPHVRALYFEAEATVCIATDDPRLKEK
jgi:hypothetical protein